MTSTTTTRTQDRSEPANGQRPSFGVTPGKRRQRKVPAAVAAAAAAVLGSLVGLTVWGAAMTTTPVLAVAQPVRAGQVITAEDLTVASVRDDPMLRPLPLSAKNTVIGKVAASDLVPGSLLVEGQVGEVRPLEAGESLVGIEVMSSAAPAGWVRSGDRVQLVSTTKSADGRSDASVLAEARVVSVAPNRTNSGAIAMTVAVPDSKGPAVNAASAGQRVGVVLLRSAGR